MKHKRPMLPLIIVALLATASGAQAYQLRNITDGELARLPEYCQDVQSIKYTDAGGGRPSPRAPHWIGLMGETFWHMHHYCWGLLRVQRAQAVGLRPEIRRGHYETAISDYYYVLRNELPGFPLKPEIYVRIGEAHVKLDQVVDAIEAFRKARELQPDYWPAYDREAGALLAINRRSEAIALIETGLRLIPDNAALKQRLQQLGGGQSKASTQHSPKGTTGLPAAQSAAAAASQPHKP